MKKKVTIYIENRPYQVEEGLSVLEACRSVGFNIPSLCNWKNHECSLASCRVCLVKIEGERRLVPSCAYDVREGLKISIADPEATMARKTNVELLLSDHSYDCQSCKKNGKCELLQVARLTGADAEKYKGVKSERTLDNVSPGIIRDTSKCIKCGRCIEACKNIQGISILGFENRGFNTIVSPIENKSFKNVPCIQCGQCTLVCPTGALMEKNQVDDLINALRSGKKVIASVAPAVRAAIGEEFGMKIGTPCTGKLASALKRLGFHRVFDLNYTADLTIMEESHEFIERFKANKNIPLITSCSPGWINFVELYYPEMVDHISSCKSPQQMMGSVLKTYYAEKNGIDPKDIFYVSFIPCVAKKSEVERPQFIKDGIRDTDLALTTRELADLIKRAGIDLKKMPDEHFDRDLIGENSGAGVIFGATGGVMEAAIRTAHFVLTGKELDPIDFKPVRGLKEIKKATVDINGIKINVAVTSGMKNAKTLLDKVKKGKWNFHFIEVMGCPGGCINGGGQPYVHPSMLPNEKTDIRETYRKKRMKILYDEDKNMPIRRSHLNPDIKKIYDEYFKEPGSELAEKVLHTTYFKNREKYPK